MVYQESIQGISMLVKVSMNDVILRLRQPGRKKNIFIFIKLDMLSLNNYRNDYRLTMNYQGVSRDSFVGLG